MAQLLVLVPTVSSQAWWHQLALPRHHHLLLHGPLPCMGTRSCGVCGVAAMGSGSHGDLEEVAVSSRSHGVCGVAAMLLLAVPCSRLSFASWCWWPRELHWALPRSLGD